MRYCQEGHKVEGENALVIRNRAKKSGVDVRCKICVRRNELKRRQKVKTAKEFTSKRRKRKRTIWQTPTGYFPPLPDAPPVLIQWKPQLTTPEQRLMLGVLTEALQCADGRARAFHGGGSKYKERDRTEEKRIALAWILEDRDDYPFSAPNICAALNLRYDKLRRWALSRVRYPHLLTEPLPRYEEVILPLTA